MAVLKMAQPSKTTNNANTNSSSSTHLQQQNQQVKATTTTTMFHDFLGMKATDSTVVLASNKPTDGRVSEASPSASASFGRAGPISSTSDLASVGQRGNHLEGIPYYGPRSEISGSEISNRLVGSKRSSSDSAFMGHESLESLHMMKMLHHGTGGERPRRSKEDEVLLGMQSVRPSSASLLLQAPPGSRPEGNTSKWEQSVPLIGSAVQYGSRGGHFLPFMHQVSSTRFKDTNVGPSVISSAAADEGSRTGIKGPGILSSINASGVPTEKNSPGAMLSGGRPKPGVHISDPESSVPPSRQGLASTSRQMTIFYGGQAHVFDDVHPNKADVIMALAGSNGGSWSTTYSPKSATRSTNENFAASGEPEAVGSMPFSRDFRGRITAAGTTSQGTGSGERISIPTGIPQGTIVIAKEARNPVKAAEPGIDDKREV